MDEVMQYVVDGGDDMRKKMGAMDNDWPQHLAIQQAWRKNEPALKAGMAAQVMEIIQAEYNRATSPVSSQP